MPLAVSQVGPLTSTSSIAAGQQVVQRAGNMGEQIISELHGRYYETSYRRAMFNAANQAAATTTVGLATTYTGLCLSNPVGSPVNLVLNKVGYSFIVAFPAAAAIGLMCGYNSSTNVTHTTAGTPRSSFFGVGATGSGLVDTAATLPTAPVLTHIFAAGLTGAITTSSSNGTYVFDLEGGVILPPGAYAAIYTSTVSGTSGFFGSMQWEEIPV
jgi:hypothetical protein